MVREISKLFALFSYQQHKPDEEYHVRHQRNQGNESLYPFQERVGTVDEYSLFELVRLRVRYYHTRVKYDQECCCEYQADHCSLRPILLHCLHGLHWVGQDLVSLVPLDKEHDSYEAKQVVAPVGDDAVPNPSLYTVFILCKAPNESDHTDALQHGQTGHNHKAIEVFMHSAFDHDTDVCCD